MRRDEGNEQRQNPFRCIQPEHSAELLDFARRSEALVAANWQKGPYRALRLNGLLQLIGVSPDLVLQ